MENKDIQTIENEDSLGASWDMFKKPCPECGTPVFVTGPRRSAFCSRQCESNYKYRNIRFKGTEKSKWISPEKVKKF